MHSIVRSSWEGRKLFGLDSATFLPLEDDVWREHHTIHRHAHIDGASHFVTHSDNMNRLRALVLKCAPVIWSEGDGRLVHVGPFVLASAISTLTHLRQEVLCKDLRLLEMLLV